MSIDWLYLLIALFLLWYPRQALRLGGALFRSHGQRRGGKVDTNPARSREAGDPAVVFSREITKLRNYIDIGRGALGSAILLGGFPGTPAALAAAPDATVLNQNLVFTALLLIVVAGVMIQSFRFEERVTMFPPIWYISGLVIGLCGPSVALFSLVLVWTINLTLPNPAGFLSVFALLVAIFGFWFKGVDNSWVYFTPFIVFLPVLVSLLARRRLVLFNKRIKTSHQPVARP